MAKLDELIEKATLDAYDESEQTTGFFTMFEEHLTLPFKTEVLGAEPRRLVLRESCLPEARSTRSRVGTYSIGGRRDRSWRRGSAATSFASAALPL